MNSIRFHTVLELRAYSLDWSAAPWRHQTGTSCHGRQRTPGKRPLAEASVACSAPPG